MDLTSLALFVEVARRGSFSAVARDRGLDASTVSRAVAGLEAGLGARLFQRSTRRLALTDAGRLYLARVGPALEVLEGAGEEVAAGQDESAGTLRLTTSHAFAQAMIGPLLGEFRRSFPRLRLELHLSDDNLDLVGAGIDLAIRLAPSYRADVIGVRLFATRYRVVASPCWVAAHGQPAEPADLSGVPCLLLSLPGYRDRWRFRCGERIEEVAVAGDLVVSNPVLLREAAIEGLGPALLADWLIAEALTGGTLVDLFPDQAITATTFETAAWLLYPSREYLPRKIRSTIDFFRKHLGQAGAGAGRRTPRPAQARPPRST